MPMNYSSCVTLTLIVCGCEVELARVGSSSVLVKESRQSFDPCDATLVVEVDGVPQRRDIFLPHGIVVGDRVEVSYI